jgi:AcrR family transcriptional regulator
MKVSQKQKTEIRQKLLDASVELFVKKGFDETTMREIAKRAGFSDGTIYNYFATKEQIFYAYFESKEDALSDTLLAIKGFDDFNLKEKLQLMLGTALEGYEADRPFVGIAFKALLDSPMRTFTELAPVRAKYVARVQRYFEVAIERKEIPPQPFERLLVNLLWDYRNLVILYWLRDDSKGFANTISLVDRSLDIFVDVVKSGIVTKTIDVGLFLIKSHVYGNIDKLYDLIGLLSQGDGNHPHTPRRKH